MPCYSANSLRAFFAICIVDKQHKICDEIPSHKINSLVVIKGKGGPGDPMQRQSNVSHCVSALFKADKRVWLPRTTYLLRSRVLPIPGGPLITTLFPAVAKARARWSASRRPTSGCSGIVSRS